MIIKFIPQNNAFPLFFFLNAFLKFDFWQKRYAYENKVKTNVFKNRQFYLNWKKFINIWNKTIKFVQLVKQFHTKPRKNDKKAL